MDFRGKEVSRSRRRPYAAFVQAVSEKKDKKRWHSKARAKVKQKLKEGKDVSLLRDDNFSNPWTMAKDGSRGYIPLKDQKKDWAIKARRK